MLEDANCNASDEEFPFFSEIVKTCCRKSTFTPESKACPAFLILRTEFIDASNILFEHSLIHVISKAES